MLLPVSALSPCSDRCAGTLGRILVGAEEEDAAAAEDDPADASYRPSITSERQELDWG